VREKHKLGVCENREQRGICGTKRGSGGRQEKNA